MKVLRGTDRPDRMRDEPDFPEPDSHDPPDDLVGPDAVDLWEKSVAALAANGVLASVDLESLEIYCNLFAKIRKLWRADETPTAALLTQFRMLATEFGFTPASRSKAGGGPKRQDTNSFAALKKDRAG